MFCQKCGKEVLSNSNYCPNCGAKIGQSNSTNGILTWLQNKFIKHKGVLAAYGIWLLIHITLWIFSNSNKESSTAFYPFNHPLSKFWDAKFSLIDNIDVYDFSEFFFYIIFLPIIIIGVNYYFPSLFKKANLINYIKKHKIAAITYGVWTFIHILLYAFSPDGVLCRKDDFYPFETIYGDEIEISFTETSSYDGSEFFFYVLVFPIIIIGFGKLLIRFFDFINKDAESPSVIEVLKAESNKTEEQTEIATNHLEKKEDDIIQSKNNINLFDYLGCRLFASVTDKLIIMVICVVLFFVVAAINMDYIGELGTYSAIFHMNGEEIYACAIGHVMQNYSDEYYTHHLAEIDDYHGYLVKLDIIFTMLFTFINIIYYSVSELIFKASFGKYYFGFRYKNKDNTDIDISNVLLRAFIFLLMLIFMIWLRWLLRVDYYIIMIIFFFLLDIPVFFTRKSFIDAFSGTKLEYIKNKSDKLK